MLEQLAWTDSLPTLPASVTRVLEAIDDEQSGVEEIADLLATDAAITGRVLSVANSALFNPGGFAFASLAEAISRIGLLEVRDIVVTTGVVDIFSEMECPFDYLGYWKHCLTTALAAGAVADRSPGIAAASRPGSNPYFVAGLLHDLGILLLVRCLRSRYTGMFSEVARRRCPLHEVEREQLDFDHGAIGAALIRRWGLPEEIAVAAEFHHDPASAPSEHRVWAEVIHLADWIADHEGLGASIEGELEPFHHGSWYHLEIDVDDIPQVITDFARAARRSDALLALT